MNYYHDVYLKRVNRYGTDFQSRIQHKREDNFEHQLAASLYKVEFEYDGNTHEGELVRKSQSETKTIHYLLTRINLDMPHGTILMIPDKNGVLVPWLIYYLEVIEASGYNRYFVLKLTHELSWTDREGNPQSTWGYMYGQEDNMLKDELRSRSRMDTLYTEALKMSFFIIPTNDKLRKDDYLEVVTKDILEAYVVTGYDIQSNPGVEFVTVDPVYIRDHSAPPEKTSEDKPEDFFWLEGGV